GFDDWPAPARPGVGWELPLMASERKAIEALAVRLRESAHPIGRTQLAVLLLAQVPADLLKAAVGRLHQMLRRDFVGMLPMEVATRILELLPVADIVRSCSLVSRRWRAVAMQACLWRRLFLRRGWRVDGSRWAFYHSLPRGVSPGRVLLGSSALRVSGALGSQSSSSSSSPSTTPSSSPSPQLPRMPINWRMLYAEYARLEANWRLGRCRVDRWEAAHSESIYCLQFDRLNRLFSGSRDATVKVWHLADSPSQITPLATLRGHSGSVLTLQADDAELVTGSSDASVCVWSLLTLGVTHRLRHPDAVLSLRFNAKWLATACKDRVVRV
ncbi:hypothetical protein GGI21_006737, partial [Coemansia aciculifera]